MKLRTQSMGIALGLIWGGGVFFVGVAHLVWPEYGTAFLDLVSSIYPGYHVGGFGSVIVGTLYAVVDGWIGGIILAWLYNRVSAGNTPAAAT